MGSGIETSKSYKNKFQNLKFVTPCKLSTDALPNFGAISQFILRVLLSFRIIYSKIKDVVSIIKRDRRGKLKACHDQ